ncbi:hypothetical protein Nepgr_023385 [Nepenthes gracilis]|uniref:Uncharacterized protein n=1 Tax=Nepenthes gracilis TaxID=150966 RepID=A0AAD3T0L6_NEPGR|nr:hypothetical protein Nepgr_023385 [Nepenthes gracilis]
MVLHREEHRSGSFVGNLVSSALRVFDFKGTQQNLARVPDELDLAVPIDPGLVSEAVVSTHVEYTWELPVCLMCNKFVLSVVI